MTEEVAMYLDEAKESMQKAIEHLERELTTMRAGKASTHMLDSIVVDYYGTQTPLAQVSNVMTTDARTIVIQPWEKPMIAVIEKAIMAANLGFNPDNNGELIRINVPPLTEERRRMLVKQVKAEGEAAKVSIRTARKDCNEGLKALKKEGISEDDVKRGEDKVQQITNEYSEKVDKIVEKKEEDIMTV